jgi:predicted RNA methylase
MIVASTHCDRISQICDADAGTGALGVAITQLTPGVVTPAAHATRLMHSAHMRRPEAEPNDVL